jgi:ACS family hexuronate transporter-like MFS transporter
MWFAPRQRALAMGIVNCGPALGSALAPPLVVWLQISFGWRAAFLVTGALSFFWLGAWLVIYPRTTSPRALVAGAGPQHAPVPWRLLLRRRQVWASCSLASSAIRSGGSI